MKNVIKIFYQLREEFWGTPNPMTKKEPTSGACMFCGHEVVNLGAHVDYCIDSQIWDT